MSFELTVPVSSVSRSRRESGRCDFDLTAPTKVQEFRQNALTNGLDSRVGGDAKTPDIRFAGGTQGGSDFRGKLELFGADRRNCQAKH